MAIAASSTRRFLLLVSTTICIFVSSTSKFGRAQDDPQLGSTGVLANGFVPQAEGEEGEANEYYPHEPGEVGAKPGPLFTKALECFHDKYLYSRCEEAYRITQIGELNVPLEYTDPYCNGPCPRETHLVLECIDEILQHFVFYNKATVKDVKETIKTGCSYGPKRGDFNVAEHILAEEDIASKMSTTISVFYALVLMIMGWLVWS